MAKIFETGNKNYVIRMACRQAIEKCLSLIDSERKETLLSQKHIDRYQARIRDFKKLIERSYP